MITRLVCSTSFLLALSACETSKKAEPVPPAVATEAAPTGAADDAAPTETATAAAEPNTDSTHEHAVACGCSLGKECSNMIEVDGKYVPLQGDVGLGEMAFCGKKDLKAKVEGELTKDGTFKATSFALVD